MITKLIRKTEYVKSLESNIFELNKLLVEKTKENEELRSDYMRIEAREKELTAVISYVLNYPSLVMQDKVSRFFRFDKSILNKCFKYKIKFTDLPPKNIIEIRSIEK